MGEPLPDARETDTWFSADQLAGLKRADAADGLRSPIPLQMVSNGEYLPIPQTAQQKEIEARVTAMADHASAKLGVSRRQFLAGSGGMAASFLAMNDVFGRFFEVDPIELFEPAAAAELAPPRNLFVFDDQLHMIRDRATDVGIALRGLAQGGGAASAAAGLSSNPFNTIGWPDEFGNPWSTWSSSLAQTPNVHSDFTLVQFIKDVFFDSQVTVGHLTNAPLGLFLPPGEAKPVFPRTIQESLDSEALTGFQTAAVRDFVNKIAGSTRLLAHGQFFPGKYNLEFMQKQIDQFHPDSWKGYTIAHSAKADSDPAQSMAQWRLDDEKVAYPTYELLRKNRRELAKHPGFFNICIHKGLSTQDPHDAADDRPENGNPDDIPKAARDWPDMNFIIYHASWAPRFFGYPSLQAIKAGEMREGVPDMKWTTRMAQQCAHLPNVYTEMGTTFAATVTTFPTVCAHLVGQVLKYMGSHRLVFGSDSLWYGAPQWQIEALWRFQIPEAMAKKYGYPRLTTEVKRRILGLNSARLYKIPTDGKIYKPVPADYARLIPDQLKKTLADEPGFQGYDVRPEADKFAALRRDYVEAGGRRENLRFGWVRR